MQSVGGLMTRVLDEKFTQGHPKAVAYVIQIDRVVFRDITFLLFTYFYSSGSLYMQFFTANVKLLEILFQG